MTTAIKEIQPDKKNNFKLKRISANEKAKYAVLQHKSVFRFLKEFKMWTYVKDESTKQVRIFKDLRSAQAYINYQTNPAMQK